MENQKIEFSRLELVRLFFGNVVWIAVMFVFGAIFHNYAAIWAGSMIHFASACIDKRVWMRFDKNNILPEGILPDFKELFVLDSLNSLTYLFFAYCMYLGQSNVWMALALALIALIVMTFLAVPQQKRLRQVQKAWAEAKMQEVKMRALIDLLNDLGRPGKDSESTADKFSGSLLDDDPDMIDTMPRPTVQPETKHDPHDDLKAHIGAA